LKKFAVCDWRIIITSNVTFACGKNYVCVGTTNPDHNRHMREIVAGAWAVSGLRITVFEASPQATSQSMGTTKNFMNSGAHRGSSNNAVCCAYHVADFVSP